MAGLSLRVKWALPKEQLPGQNPTRVPEGPRQAGLSEQEVIGRGLDPTRLFVGQLDRAIDPTGGTMRKVFEQYGQLVEVKLMAEKGVCIIQYKTFEEAKLAVATLNNKSFPGISNALNVQYAKRGPSAGKGTSAGKGRR